MLRLLFKEGDLLPSGRKQRAFLQDIRSRTAVEIRDFRPLLLDRGRDLSESFRSAWLGPWSREYRGQYNIIATVRGLSVE